MIRVVKPGPSGRQPSRPRRAPGGSPAHPMQALQRAVGNRALAGYLLARAAARRQVQRQKKPAEQGPWYQKLLDRIDVEAKEPGYSVGPGHLIVLRGLLGVAQAIDAGDKDKIDQAVKDLDAALDKGYLDPAGVVDLGNDIPMQLISRAILAGAPDAGAKLQAIFRSTRWNAADFDRPTTIGVWTEVQAQALAKVDLSKADSAASSIEALLAVVSGITGAAGQLDQDAIRKERVEAADKSRYYSAGDEYLFGSRSSTPGSQYSALLDLLPPLIVALWKCFQKLMDAAIDELGAAKGTDALEKAKSVLQGKMYPVLDALEKQVGSMPRYDYFMNVLLRDDIQVEITRSTWSKKSGQHLDVFSTGKKPPSVKVERYEEGNVEIPEPEKALPLTRLVQIRYDQIALLERLAGTQKDKGQVTEESKENAALIASAGGLKLHDNESWRKFLLAKLKAQRAAGKSDDDALAAIIDLLGAYLKAFTFHTPLNIDEFGDNYLTRTFPRALTGQLLHDCGVYALRIAYALSLVRDELGLSFKAILLPVHVGLIITQGPGHPIYLAHNEQITPLGDQAKTGQAATLTTLYEAWSGTTLPSGQPPPLDEKFLAVLAAGTFISGVDVPYQMVDIPGLPKDAAKAEKKLWDFYHSDMLKPVLKATKDVKQPELKYLELLEQEKRIYNSLGVTFWLQARARWEKDQQALNDAFAKLQKDKKKDEYEAAVAPHRDALAKLAEPLRDAYGQLQTKRDEVSKWLADNPKALTKGTQVASYAPVRLTPTWQLELNAYLGNPNATDPAAQRGTLLEGSGISVKPPWTEPLPPLD